MSTRKLTTDERNNFAGRTVLMSSGDGLPIQKVRPLLQIRTRLTFNRHLKALGLYGRKYISWEDIKEVLKLQLFLGIKPGYNSRKMYLILKERGKIDAVFKQYQINVNQHLEMLKKCQQKLTDLNPAKTDYN